MWQQSERQEQNHGKNYSCRTIDGGMDVTELPGRKALFTGAVAPTIPANPSEEIAPVRESEQTIAELRQRLDVMVSNNPVPMLLTTPGFSIVEANAAYIEMSGIRERDLLKTNLKNFKIISQKGEGAKVALLGKTALVWRSERGITLRYTHSRAILHSDYGQRPDNHQSALCL